MSKWSVFRVQISYFPLTLLQSIWNFCISVFQQGILFYTEFEANWARYLKDIEIQNVSGLLWGFSWPNLKFGKGIVSINFRDLQIMQAGLKPPGSEASAVLRCHSKNIYFYFQLKRILWNFSMSSYKAFQQWNHVSNPSEGKKNLFALQSLTGNFISPNKVLEHLGIHCHFAMPACNL